MFHECFMKSCRRVRMFNANVVTAHVSVKAQLPSVASERIKKCRQLRRISAAV